LDEWVAKRKIGGEQYRRRAPLEQGRNGLMKNHFTFYSNAKALSRSEDLRIPVIAMKIVAIMEHKARYDDTVDEFSHRTKA
jgi:hypothetical protein